MILSLSIFVLDQAVSASSVSTFAPSCVAVAVADRLVAKGYAPLALNGKQPIATDQLRDSVWRHE